MPQRRLATRRFLATILFTDIVGSTQHAARLGDRAWRDLVERHDAVVRRELKVYGGREMDTAGDGFFAVFEAPERAVRCAEAITTATAVLGLPVRAGVHMGECEVIGGKVGGMAVAIGSRVVGLAGPGEVLVSGSVRDLMTGSDRHFDGGDPQQLKGVADQWRVYRLVPETADVEANTSRSSPLVPLYTRRHKRRVVVVVAALLVLVLALSGAYLMTRADRDVLVGENAAGLLDGDTLVAAVRVGERPTGVAVGAGSVWVTNSTGGTVSRIDLETETAVPIPVGLAPSGVALGAGSAWVANSGNDTVTRIDVTTHAATTIDVAPGPTGVVFAAGSVWVTNASNASVTEIDPATNRVVGEVVPVGGTPTGIAYGAGSLWVSNHADGTVTRLDPSTRLADAPIKVGNGPVGIAVGDGSVWVANSIDGSLSRVDIDDQSVDTRTLAAAGGAYGVAASGENVWVSNQYAGTLSQVNTQGFTLVRNVRTGGAPLGLAMADDRLWFANAGGGRTLHRGGVLTLAAGARHSWEDKRVIDPSGTFHAATYSLLAATNDGLVGFRREGGVQGSQLVPDLATSLSSPTDGGRTYTYHLRHGVRYSTGGLAQPGDIRRAIERTLQHRQGSNYLYEVIEGGTACRRRPETCDLSTGIVTDESNRTVTFHLTEATPDFPYRLALPPAFAVPTETPTRLPTGDFLPATGPYMIAAYRRHGAGPDGDRIPATPGRVELVRNPHFREWSQAAQPAGYADRIVIDTGLDRKEAVRRVAEGRADSLWFGVPQEHVDPVRIRYPDQLHATAGNFTAYMFLNTARPPFDNRDARRAVAFAVNRGAIASETEGAGFGRVTCQLLPPGFAGYESYCPYSLDGDGEEWTAPDLAEAQRLVEASGTKGDRVVMQTSALSPGRTTGQRLADMLSSIGYNVTLRAWPNGEYFDRVFENHAQAGIAGWFSDYPAASTFFPDLFRCRTGKGTNGGSFNLSFFCYRRIDRQIDLALKTQATDPAGAAAMWRELDRTIVDEAPIVPISNDVRHDFVSKRVGNSQNHPQFYQLIAQMWVQ